MFEKKGGSLYPFILTSLNLQQRVHTGTVQQQQCAHTVLKKVQQLLRVLSYDSSIGNTEYVLYVQRGYVRQQIVNQRMVLSYHSGGGREKRSTQSCLPSIASTHLCTQQQCAQCIEESAAVASRTLLTQSTYYSYRVRTSADRQPAYGAIIVEAAERSEARRVELSRRTLIPN